MLSTRTSNVALATECPAAYADEPPQQNAHLVRAAHYFDGPRDFLVGHLHYLRDAPARNTVVVICNPIGFEYMHAHRTLRHLADKLARAGIPTLRFDYDGTGDSSGTDLDGERLKSWRSSVTRAIAHARQATGLDRVCVLGLRFGATLAALAASEVGAQHLVLWEPYTSGRKQVRDLRALAMARHSAARPSQGHLDSAGLAVTPETLSQILEVNLLEQNFKSIDSALIVSTRLDADFDRLFDHLERQGAHTTHLTVSGYDQMMFEPEFSEVPYLALDSISNWLVNQSQEMASASPLSTTTLSVRFAESGPKQAVLPIQEQLCRFGPDRALFGIVTQPGRASNRLAPTLVLPNPGASHHVGPNRLYVNLARKLAAQGITSIRFDLEGFGESVSLGPELGNNAYTKTATRDLGLAFDFMIQEFGSREFTAGGLCSAAHGAFRAAADASDIRIRTILLINPLTYRFDEAENSATWRNYSDARILKVPTRGWRKWLKQLKLQVPWSAAIDATTSRIWNRVRQNWKDLIETIKPAEVSEISRDIAQILGKKIRIGLFISSTDPGYDILMAQARRATREGVRDGGIQVQFIRGADHTFSTLQSRVALIESVCGFLIPKDQIKLAPPARALKRSAAAGCRPREGHEFQTTIDRSSASIELDT